MAEWEKYRSEIYDPSVSRAVFETAKEVSKEYNRLRRVANQRLARLENAGYGDSAIMRRYGEGFGSVRGMTEAQKRAKLGEVAKFLGLKTSSVSGQREATRSFIESMHEKGYDFINKNNAAAFGRFMEAAKKHYGSKKAFDSELIVDLFERTLEADADPEQVATDFDYWTENMDQLRPPQTSPEDFAQETAERQQRKAEQRERAAENRRESSRKKKESERRARVEERRRQIGGRKGRKGRK